MTFKTSCNCLKASLILFFLLLFQVSFSQGGFSSLDEIVVSKQKLLGPDVVMMVATKDTVVYQKVNKIFNGRAQAPLGHSSQWLTAALILQLVDEGKLSLDDKVSSYLPVFEKYGKNYITLRHCLTHFTGIQAESPKPLKLFEKKKFASLEEEVAFFASREIQTNPGTEARYSLVGPAIAARVAEVVTKKRFDMLVQQKLFRPLGMRQTTFSTLDGSSVNPATGARTTANDMVLFLRMLLNNGTGNKAQKILSPESVQELFRVQADAGSVKNSPDATKGFAYALGAWAPDGTTGKAATLLTSPSLGGTQLIVDACRGYVFLPLLKAETEEAKANTYGEVKDVLEGLYPKKCQ